MPDSRSGSRWGALWRPRGPLPPSAYWLRRTVVVLVALAVVVFIVIVAIRHGGGSKPSAVAVKSPTPQSSGSPAPTTTGAAGSPTPSAAPTESTPTASTAPAPCAAAQVALTVTTSARAYPGLAAPSFTATATSTGAGCALTGPAMFVVRSGSDRVWANTDCATAGTGTSTLVPPTAGASVSRSWERVRTNPGCAAVLGSKVAAAGTYRVTVTWGPVTSAEATFTLS